MALSEEAGKSAAAGTSKTDAASDGGWGSGVVIAIWVGQIVYAVLLNRDYLRWKAVGKNEWYYQPVDGTVNSHTLAPPPRQASVPQPPPFLGVDTSTYFANAPAPQAPSPPPPPAAETPQRSTSAPIDINSASPGEIAMLAGIDDALVKRVVDARIRRGGFRGLDDLVAGAGLQPHEMLKLRDKVTFGAYAANPPSTSRAASQPDYPTQPGNGRILDY